MIKLFPGNYKSNNALKLLLKYLIIDKKDATLHPFYLLF